MKNLVLFFGLFVFCSQGNASSPHIVNNCDNEIFINYSLGDPIKVKLYGKGGIIVVGDKSTVCPEASSVVCANIEMQSPKVDDDKVSSDTGILTIERVSYKIRNVTSRNNMFESPTQGHNYGSNFSFIFVNR